MDGPDRTDTRQWIDSHDLHKHNGCVHTDAGSYTQIVWKRTTTTWDVDFFPLFFLIPQINLQRRMRVTGLITQGAKRIGSPEYVKSYKVAYSDDGKTWRTYKVKGKDEDMVSETHTWEQKHRHTHTMVMSPLFPFSYSICNTQTTMHACTPVHTQRLETALSVKGRVEDMMRWLFN